MWYMNETNTETITIAEVIVGDIITLDTNPAHGYKVYDVSGSRLEGRKQIKGGMGTWQAPMETKVLRLLFDTDGYAIPASERNAKVVPHTPRFQVKGCDTDEMEADEYRNG